MAEIEKKPVKVVETILRDAHQSLIATRMTTDEFSGILEKLDKIAGESNHSRNEVINIILEHGAENIEII